MNPRVLLEQRTYPDLYSLLSEYQSYVSRTDSLPADDLVPVLLGLNGEVGSLMTAAKKSHRENDVYTNYRNTVSEELGDVLWYLTAYCARLDILLADIFCAEWNEEAGCTPSSVDDCLLGMGRVVSHLPRERSTGAPAPELARLAGLYMVALSNFGLDLQHVAALNLGKAYGRFVEPEDEDLPTFDDGFPPDEQIPQSFAIDMVQKSSGRSHLRWNGVFIGDPLSDNIQSRDGYRFHDVFHFSHAAVLHWSPTFRALIKHKRKSNPQVDDAQDSGRAIVIEEGLTAWLFSYAKESAFFEGYTRLPFDLLKTVHGFVRGYEVEACPMRLWESAILQGFDVFRQLHACGGGRIIGDRTTRTVRYEGGDS